MGTVPAMFGEAASSALLARSSLVWARRSACGARQGNTLSRPTSSALHVRHALRDAPCETNGARRTSRNTLLVIIALRASFARDRPFLQPVSGSQSLRWGLKDHFQQRYASVHCASAVHRANFSRGMVRQLAWLAPQVNGPLHHHWKTTLQARAQRDWTRAASLPIRTRLPLYTIHGI